MTAGNRAITVIESLDQMPDFATEEEEAALWDTHEMSDDLWRSLPRIPDALLPPVRSQPMPKGKRT